MHATSKSRASLASLRTICAARHHNARRGLCECRVSLIRKRTLGFSAIRVSCLLATKRDNVYQPIRLILYFPQYNMHIMVAALSHRYVQSRLFAYNGFTHICKYFLTSYMSHVWDGATFGGATAQAFVVIITKVLSLRSDICGCVNGVSDFDVHVLRFVAVSWGKFKC